MPVVRKGRKKVFCPDFLSDLNYFPGVTAHNTRRERERLCSVCVYMFEKMCVCVYDIECVGVCDEKKRKVVLEEDRESNENETINTQPRANAHVQRRSEIKRLASEKVSKKYRSRGKTKIYCQWILNVYFR